LDGKAQGRSETEGSKLEEEERWGSPGILAYQTRVEYEIICIDYLFHFKVFE